MQWLLGLSVLLFSTSGLAEYSLGFGGRSYPLASSFFAEWETKKFIWGEEKDRINGYIRPYLRVTSIGLTHTGKAELEIDPINALGIYVGGAVLQSNSALTGINCDIYSCEGYWSRSYWAIEPRVPFGKVAITSLLSRTTIDYPAASANWIDPISNLAFKGRTGIYTSLESRMVYLQSDTWVYGIMSEVDWKSDQSDVAADSQYIFVKYNPAPWAFFLGLGRYNGGEYLPTFSMLGFLRYVLP